MKHLIEQILVEKKFNIDKHSFENPNSFIAERIEYQKFDFLTVMFEKINSITVENFKTNTDQLLELIIENKQQHIGLDKNLSLLLLIESNTLDISNEVKSLIFDIEEDPYDFKKYVLVYTNEQIAKLKERVGTSSINGFLNSFLNDTANFTAFKRNELSDDKIVYDLVSKLFIKLPYLNLNNNLQQLSNLSEEIETGIDDIDKGIWKKLLDLDSNLSEEPSIDEILECIGVHKIE